MTDVSTRQPYVEPIKVFNLPLFERFCVLDVRDASAFAASHVFSSWSHPQRADATPEERVASLIEIFERMDDYGYERLSPIVLFCDAASESHAASIAAALRQLHADPAVLALLPASLRLSSVMLPRFRDGDGEVWVCDADAFCAAFPFLCSPAGTPPPVGDVPLPACVYPHLFVGSRAMGIVRPYLSRAVCDAMGITHIVCAGGGGVREALGETGGIWFLELAAPDADDWDEFDQHMDAACAVVDAARASGGRALVFLHGRSRSCAVAIAYVMHHTGCSLADAARLVAAACPRADPTLVCPAALLRRSEARRERERIAAPPPQGGE